VSTVTRGDDVRLRHFEVADAVLDTIVVRDFGMSLDASSRRRRGRGRLEDSPDGLRLHGLCGGIHL